VRRRAFLATCLATPLGAPLLFAARDARAVDYPPVVAGTPLAFPRDHGSHPAFRTEWWYVTGIVRDAAGNDYGVQVTFFRTRTGLAEDNPSAFAPRQILFAHAALADPRRGRLLHDQRAARTGFGLAEAREDTTGVWIGDWSLALAGDRYVARIAARGFALDLAFAPTQAVLPHGELGYSRKGPDPRQASFYYSQPQLAATGRIGAEGRTVEVAGTAWLDHEWSSGIMAPDAVGWDWVGLNLDDGGALMAFRMRARDGSALWAGGTLRGADGRTRTFGPDAIRFAPLRRWRSPRTEATYPVALAVEVAGVEYALQPLFDDQELDSRASTGTIYWEGAVRATVGGRDAGRGYLELTGYWKPMRL
jgi:predicted secreted hydrolase